MFRRIAARQASVRPPLTRCLPCHAEASGGCSSRVLPSDRVEGETAAPRECALPHEARGSLRGSWMGRPGSGSTGRANPRNARMRLEWGKSDGEWRGGLGQGGEAQPDGGRPVNGGEALRREDEVRRRRARTCGKTKFPFRNVGACHAVRGNHASGLENFEERTLSGAFPTCSSATLTGGGFGSSRSALSDPC